MIKKSLSYSIKWLMTDREDGALVRGGLLYLSLAIIFLGGVGVLFSPKYQFFAQLMPAAIIMAVVVLSGRFLGRVVGSGRLLEVGLYSVILMYVLLGLLNAYVGARVYDGSQYDGAFQLFFPLKRMEAGEWPGKDFFYFHGQLIPWVVYPLFKGFGSDFFAAQLSGKLIDLFIPFFYFLIFHWLGLRRSGLLIAWLLLVGLLVTDRFTFGTQNPIDGVHVYTLRSIVPFLYIAFVSSQWANEQYREGFLRQFYQRAVFIQSLVFVLSFYLGSEQAFYLLPTLMLANALAIGARFWHILCASICLALLSLALVVLSNMLLFGSQQPLTYLVEISRNQTWFYGSYPNEFLHAALDFSRFNSSTFKVSAKVLVCLVGLPILWRIAWRLLSKIDRRLFYFLLFGGTYGLLGLTSLLASYAGEQYVDSAIKVMLIGLIVLFVKMGLGEIKSAWQGGGYDVFHDLTVAAPWVLLIFIGVSVYSIFFVLNVKSNMRVYKVLDSAIFMDQPDLGVKIPFYQLNERPDVRYHSSQFLALEYAQGNEKARVIYPEFTFVDGFDGGVKNLYRVKVDEDIPEPLSVGDFCRLNGIELMVADIDKEKKYLYFDQSTVPAGQSNQASSAQCYRKQGQDYITYDRGRVALEQATYDNYFYDGLFRGELLQVRVKDGEQKKLRVGDGLVLKGHGYSIKAVYANGVVVLDSAVHPLPFDFDSGSTYGVFQRIKPDGGLGYTLDIAEGELPITQVKLDDREVLAEISRHRQMWSLNNGQSASVLQVDMAQGIVSLRGHLKPDQALYGLHFGQLDKAAFNTVGTITPVFQLMKGILSAKTVESVPLASSIDFFFHTFNTSLLTEYLKGIQTLDPAFISAPSGRYVNNFIWYDNWLVRARWPVFEFILSSYDPVAHSKFESFWKKGRVYSGAAPWVELDPPAKSGNQDIVIPAAADSRKNTGCETSAYVVELEYALSGWQQSMPLLGGNTRHIALIDDYLGVPLTFNPNEHRVSFPVFPRGSETRIHLKSIAPLGIDTALDISAVRYRKLNLPAERLAGVIGRSASGYCP